MLLSGGIDSSGCVHFYHRQRLSVGALFVDYGQAAAKAELKSAHAVCSFYGVSLRELTLRDPQIPKSGEITGRNLLLVGAALMAVGSKTRLIALGIHGGTRYFDCSPAFTKLCNHLLEGYTDGRVRIAAPFLKTDKAGVWEYCRRNRVPVNLTWSCEASSASPCRKCLSCKDKDSLLARA